MRGYGGKKRLRLLPLKISCLELTLKLSREKSVTKMLIVALRIAYIGENPLLRIGR